MQADRKEVEVARCNELGLRSEPIVYQTRLLRVIELSS